MVIAAALLGLAAIAAPAPGIGVRDILEVTDLSGLSTSPDGRWLAFRSEQPSLDTNSYRQRWYVVALDGDASPHAVADAGEALFTDAGTVAVQTPIWAPASDAIYFCALVGGEIQLWRAPIDGEPARKVTDDPANVRDVALAPDRRSLIYHVAATRDAIEQAERSAHDDGVLIDASIDPAQPISRGSFIDGRPASERLTGSWFDHGDILWRTPLRAVVLPLPAVDQAAAPGPDDIRTNGGSISATPGKTILTIHRAGAPDLICPTSQCRNDHINSAVPLAGGQSYLVTTSDRAHAQTLTIWRPGEPRARVLAASKGLLNGDRDDDDAPCAVAPRAIACIEASPSVPPRLVLLDPATGRRRIAFAPNARLAAHITTPIRALAWRATNGTPFTAQLFLPSGVVPPGGFPLVIDYYYCAGFLRGGIGDELPLLPLAAHGVATLCMNRARWLVANPTRAWEYAIALDGIRTIIGQLAGEGLVNRKRVGMAGLSFGSEIVTAVAENSNLLAAAAISTVQQEPSFYWFNTVAGRDTAQTLRDEWQVGDPDSDRAGWKAISPAFNIASIHAPLLMQLPENEMRLSMEFYSRLSRSPTPVELYAFANESHVKREPRHKLAVYERNLDWFRFWLTGAIDPAPQKADQYRRWQSFASRPGYAVAADNGLRP